MPPDMTTQPPCAGDDQQQWINMTAGYSRVGPIQFTGASSIVNQIQDDQRVYNPPLTIGEQLVTASGAKETVVSDFNDRPLTDNQTNVVFQSGLTNIHAKTTYTP